MTFVSFRSRLIKFFLMFAGISLAFVLLGTEAYAQNYRAGLNGANGRKFPTEAYRGDFKMLDYPYVMLDGKRERLVPGSRIIDTKNRVIRPRSISGERKMVNYVRFKNGQLHTVWLLSAKEVREKRKTANPKWWDKLFENLDWIDIAKWYGLGQLGL